MIKNLLNKIFTTLLTLIMLCSTVTIPVEKHYCGDNLIDLAYFTSVEKCGEMSSESNSKKEVVSKSCCKNIAEVIMAQNELDYKEVQKLRPVEKLFLVTLFNSYYNSFEEQGEKPIQGFYYRNPLIVYDITILDQVFLI